jgi:MFS family permease
VTRVDPTGAASPVAGGTARQSLLFAVLYFAEGVPIGFLWWALPSVLREQSVDVASITTLTAALTVPWTLKFLAGPLVDRSVERGVRLRDWILACQVMMGLALLPLAAGEAAPAFRLLLGLLFVHACFAALQDVAIDALCIRSVRDEHLGAVNGWMQFGMTAGRATAAAAVPLLIHAAGWRVAIVAIVALIWAPMIVLLVMVREPRRGGSPVAATRGSLRGLLDVMLLPAIAVALLAGAGFEAAGAVAGPLLVDLGLEVEWRSVFFGAVAPAGLALGGLVAARSADRLGLRESVAAGVVAAVAAVVVLAASVADGPASAVPARAVALLGLVYLAAGFLVSASYALFMQVARGRWRATRFSLLMAATNGCEAGAGFAAGRLVPALGYGGALAALAALSLVSLPLLRHVRADGGQADDTD